MKKLMIIAAAMLAAVMNNASAQNAKQLTAEQVANAVTITLNKGIGAGYDGERESGLAAVFGANYSVNAKSFYDNEGNLVVFEDANGESYSEFEWEYRRVTGPRISAGCGAQGAMTNISVMPYVGLGMTFPFWGIEGSFQPIQLKYNKSSLYPGEKYNGWKWMFDLYGRIQLAPKGTRYEMVTLLLGVSYGFIITQTEEANGTNGTKFAKGYSGTASAMVGLEGLISSKAGLRWEVRGHYGGPENMNDYTFHHSNRECHWDVRVGINWTPGRTHDSDFKKEFCRQLSPEANARINNMRK